MLLPRATKGLRLRAFLPIALAYLLALNGLLAGFGSAAGASIGSGQHSLFANVICAAAAAASDDGGASGIPAKAPAHPAHHCVLCGLSSSSGAAPDQLAVLPAFELSPEREPGTARPAARSTAPPLSDTGFMSSRTTRAPPLTV